MSIQFKCAQCQTTLRAKAEKAGRRAKCKKCGAVVKVPEMPGLSARPDQVSKQQRAASRVNALSQPDEASPTDAMRTSSPQANPPKSPQAKPSKTEGAANSLTPPPADDPFANLPEFQTLEAPVERHVTADEEFQRLMMGEEQPALFPAADQTGQVTPADQSVVGTDHADIAGIIDQFDGAIQNAVEKQKRSVRPKFSVDQIRDAFRKPLGERGHTDRLRGKQFLSALSVALVPIGFVCVVVLGSIAMVGALGTWLFNDSGQILSPFIGLPMILLTIALLLAWVPAISLMIAGVSLLIPRRFDAPAATQLTRESQPVMYEFVDQICDKLGSPKPCRIDLDCEFNASAGLRRGWFSSGKKDLVLTIGIPFIAIQNTEQLASVIAHEFGHFRQGTAMKTSYVIQGLTRWFILSAVNGMGYYYFYFGYLTHMLSGSLSREMEWDADRQAVHLAGTKAFVESSAVIERYGVAYSVTIENLIALFHNGALVDNVPRLMMHIGRTMPAAVIRRIAEATEKERQSRFDSHPPTRDRVNAARELNQEGVLSLGQPATDLIDNWTPLCKKITRDFYTEKLGLEHGEISACHMTPLEELLRDEHKLLLDLAEKKGK